MDDTTAGELAIQLFRRPKDEPVALRIVGRDSRETYRVVGVQTEAGQWRLIIEEVPDVSANAFNFSNTDPR